MEGGEDVGHQTPASPATEYLHTTVLSFRMLCVFETTVPIDDSETFKVIREVLLPLNPRFSSILVKHAGKSGLQWQRVNMNLEDHVRVPSFPKGLSSAQYEEHWYDYLSQIAMESFPEQRPLWEVHLFKYPFRNAAGAVVLKLHHALGDGFSLMGALFSCLKRADDPSLPLTFPATSSAAMSGSSMGEDEKVVSSRGKKAISMVMGCCNTLEDVVKSLLHSTVMKDARSCIRSGRSQVEYLPTAFSSVVLSLARIKEVKNQVAGTVNDVVTGMLFFGIHLYNQKKGQPCSGRRMTAVVLLNTRMVRGYQKIEEMVEKKSWGNHFTLLHVPIPPCINTVEEEDPLKYISQAKQAIERQRSSLAFFVIGSLLSLMGKISGPEAVSRYIYNSLHNTSVALSNLVGPVEQVAIGGHPVKNLYFYMAGVPQSVTTGVLSYMDQLTMTVCAEKGFVDPILFTQCVNEAFEKIYNMACGKN